MNFPSEGRTGLNMLRIVFDVMNVVRKFKHIKQPSQREERWGVQNLKLPLT